MSEAKRNEESKLTDLLYAVVDEAKTVYGEPQYKFYKLNVRWSQPRTRSGRKRGRGSHFTESPSDNNEVSEQEYLDNITDSKRQMMAAFMGELKTSYVMYEKKLVKGGWREHLIELIKGI